MDGVLNLQLGSPTVKVAAIKSHVHFCNVFASTAFTHRTRHTLLGVGFYEKDRPKEIIDGATRRQQVCGYQQIPERKKD
jgi:hypothetical protein